jgi:hypothetical protein
MTIGIKNIIQIIRKQYNKIYQSTFLNQLHQSLKFILLIFNQIIKCKKNLQIII